MRIEVASDPVLFTPRGEVGTQKGQMRSRFQLDLITALLLLIRPDNEGMPLCQTQTSGEWIARVHLA